MERETQSSGDAIERARLTRREMLKAGAAAALSLGAGASLDAAQPGIPQNLRTSKPVLTQGDLKFLGFYRFPVEAGDLWYAYTNLAMRKVGGQTRLFTTGNWPADQVYPAWGSSPVIELAVPDAAPSTVFGGAPTLALSRNWGPIMQGRQLTGGAAGSAMPGGLMWDDTRNALWWSYGSTYVPAQHHPTIGATQLNDSNGSTQSYGPWRTEWHCQRTRGALTMLPAGFASSYTGGKRMGIMSFQMSGNAKSPFGAILSAAEMHDPVTTPADTETSTHWTVANHGLILHDLEHRQSRDTNYKTCGWSAPNVTQNYDCRLGQYLTAGIPLFGGSSPAAGENDTINCGVWVDLPDKHGLVYFGQLVTTPDGYRAPGDPDGLVHMWYGDPDHATKTGSNTAGFTDGKCCHGQDDPWWQGTGTAAHYRVPMGWIYNPDDLIDTAQRRADLWSRKPTSTFQVKPSRRK